MRPAIAATAAPRFLSRHAACLQRLAPLLMRGTVTVLLFGSLCLPAGATTLVRCKVNQRIVYSDSDCPADAGGHRRSDYNGFPVSKPITIRIPRKAAGTASSPRKSRSH